MFPGCLDIVSGRLRVKNSSIPPDAAYNHGLAFGPDFVYANFNSPIGYVNGLPYTPGKQVSMQNLGVAGVSNGLPYSALGSLAIIEDVPDRFINGLPFNGGQLAIVVVP
jgi:hypothetical protein